MTYEVVTLKELERLTQRAPVERFTEVRERVRVVTESRQGPPGPRGPGGSNTHAMLAAAVLGGHRVVVSTPTGAVHASADAEDHSARVVGITLGAASLGAEATVQSSGSITELSWSWTPDEDIFLGLNGVLTQTIPPTAAFAQRVGYAVTPTQIWVDLGEPIII